MCSIKMKIFKMSKSFSQQNENIGHRLDEDIFKMTRAMYFLYDYYQ